MCLLSSSYFVVDLNYINKPNDPARAIQKKSKLAKRGSFGLSNLFDTLVM